MKMQTTKYAVVKNQWEQILAFKLTSFTSLIIFVILASLVSCQSKTKLYKPVIDGEWHTITHQPDLGQYTGKEQEPVDFAVWQAEDGTWQLWSCIRFTNIGGNTRLFHRWEGKSLSDTAWQPMGIAMQADTTLGETAGGLQAPYVFKENGTYYMFYGDWGNICLATSKDGKTFTRVLNEKGNATLFTGPLYNTRDAMVIKEDNTYYCYYSAHNKEYNKSAEPQTAIYCRTSTNLKNWGEPVVVSRGGSAMKQSNWHGGDAECPFVVKVGKQYVLFRNQLYGEKSLNTQYSSSDLLNFGDNNDEFMVSQLNVAAPEIIKDGDQYYIVALNTSLDGMRIAKLKFDVVTKN
ncbi:MAG: hypothetical protein KF746_20890 [Chitinophagaceae bacterium]|nr:hypothetical protein [Chitinophagaceae bacterium]